jgi:hypothetical protein
MGWTQAELDAYYERLKQGSVEDTALNVLKKSRQLGVTAQCPTFDRPAKNPKPRMNLTEAEYAQQLALDERAGLIQWWAFEPFKLRLADATYYTPDFAVLVWLDPDPGSGNISTALEFREVKGFWRDDARVKIKVAAEMFPFKFVAITKRSKITGGGWDVEEFRGAH